MLKLSLFLIAFSLFFTSGNAFLGLFDDNPQFLIIEEIQAGARLYTGISPISVDNDGNEIGLNVLSTSDWNGLFDGFEGLDLNFTVLDRCSGDANSVWTSANNCQDITNFNTGEVGAGDGGTDTNIFAGGNIDVNTNTAGHVLVSFDDENFLNFKHLWTDQNFSRIDVFDLNLTNLLFNGIDFNTVYDPRYLDFNNHFNRLASLVSIETVNSATFDTVQEFIYNDGSAGVIDPKDGIITDGGGGTIDVNALQGAIRVSDMHIAQLLTFDFNRSTGHAIDVNTIRYVGIDYNAGNPGVIIKSSDVWNGHDEFALGAVVNEDGTLHIINNPTHVANSPAHILERFYNTFPLKRGDRIGGLIIGETGTRNVTVTAGTLYDRVNEFSISAIDTNGADSFDSYSSSGLESKDNNSWDNANYDNAGTLTALTVNRFANAWFWIESDGQLVHVYGTDQYATAGQAETEGVPAVIPDRLIVHGKLIGRIIFRNGAATATDIQTVFATTFAATGVTTHSLLATLGWTSAGHIGTALSVAGFDGAGTAIEYPVSDWNRSSVFDCSGDVNSVLNSVGDCVSIAGFDTGGVGGGLSEVDANALYIKQNPIAPQTITGHELIIESDLNFTDSSGTPTGSWDNDANRICLGFNCQSFMDWNGDTLIFGTR